eukprot:272654_1
MPISHMPKTKFVSSNKWTFISQITNAITNIIYIMTLYITWTVIISLKTNRNQKYYEFCGIEVTCNISLLNVILSISVYYLCYIDTLKWVKFVTTLSGGSAEYIKRCVHCKDVIFVGIFINFSRI